MTGSAQHPHSVAEVDLVIIEAPGKLAMVHRCFDAMGYAATVVATIGHLYRYPSSMDQVGIAWTDDGIVEERLPERPDAFAYLQSALKRCTGRVVIATDDDVEGHVIAEDVAHLATVAGVSGEIVRALPHAMTAEAWATALKHACPLNPEDARPGVARRILDRLIACTSRGMAGARAIGRVQSALLGMGAAGGVPDRAVCIAAPAADGRGPFRGEGVMHGAVPEGALPALVTERCVTEPMADPMHGGDTLLALAGELKLPVGEIGGLLQVMYEAGEISYPRSSGRGLRAAGAAAVARIARARAIRAFSSSRLPQLAPTDGPAHEAVHVVLEGMIERLDLGRPLRLCATTREAAAVVIARRSVESGIGVVRERPVLAALPAWARSLDWKREGLRSALPWRAPVPPSERKLDLGVSLVHAQMRTGLGRASTWARHAERGASSGWFSSGHTLSLPGRVAAGGVGPALRDPSTSVAIDRILENPRLDVRERVEEALTLALDGDSGAVQLILSGLAKEEACNAPALSPPSL